MTDITPFEEIQTEDRESEGELEELNVPDKKMVTALKNLRREQSNLEIQLKSIGLKLL